MGDVTEEPSAGLETQTDPADDSLAGGTDGADGGNGAVPVIGPWASATATVGQEVEGFGAGAGVGEGPIVGALGLMLVWPPQAANIETVMAISRANIALQAKGTGLGVSLGQNTQRTPVDGCLEKMRASSQLWAV